MESNNPAPLDCYLYQELVNGEPLVTDLVQGEPGFAKLFCPRSFLGHNFIELDEDGLPVTENEIYL